MSSQIKSAQSKQEVEIDTKPETAIRPPDGGWGWMVCFAAFMTNFTIVGLVNSNGIILLGLLDLFDETVSKTALVGAFLGGITMFGGPLVLVLLIFNASHRQVMMLGGITSAASTAASAFVPTIEIMIFTYGILAGTSLAINYFAANVILACYFDNKRAIALGIASSGAGIGSILLCYLIEISISFYGMRGTFLMIGGLLLNLTVYGALCRPLKPVAKSSRRNSETIRVTPDKEKDGLLNSSLAPEDVNSETQVENGATPCLYSEPSDFRSLVSRYCDAVILRNKTFGILNTVYFLWAVGESALIYLPLYATSIGLSREDSAMIMSIFGVIYTIAPILAGFLADILHTPTSYLFLVATFGIALSILSFSFCQTLAALISSAIAFSISFSFGITLRIVLVAAIVGIDKMSAAFGIMTMSVGIGYAVYPIISGIAYDTTHSFPVIFYMNAGIAFLGAILSCGIVYAQKAGAFFKKEMV